MMHIYTIYFLFFLLFTSCNTNAQRDIRLMFYNVENLFDTSDDPTVNDNEYLPNGSLYWTNKKYNQKLQNIYKVIISVGEWSPPEIIGLCEVENKGVINDLITKTPLSNFKFGIVHFNSPDLRGIDVALLYRTDKLSLISEKYIPVIFPEKFKTHKTRNILLAQLATKNNNTLYVFVNHWPSRQRGEKESDDFRLWTAQILKTQTDSILSVEKNAKIAIIGDFNDEPHDESILKGLSVSNICQNPSRDSLYNISTNFLKNQKTGTIKHQGQWFTFDQIIVSGSLLNNSKGFSTSPDKARVFNAAFILQADKRNLGFSPYRSFSGRKYIGGFSDHLPVYLDLVIKK